LLLEEMAAADAEQRQHLLVWQVLGVRCMFASSLLKESLLDEIQNFAVRWAVKRNVIQKAA